MRQVEVGFGFWLGLGLGLVNVRVRVSSCRSKAQTTEIIVPRSVNSSARLYDDTTASSPNLVRS
jgi:hypothetical protein